MRLTTALVACLGLTLAGSSGAPAQSATGAELAGRLGCFACHALHGRGGRLAAALDGAGRRLSRPELEVILTYPRRLYPEARMPSYEYLPPAERQALADFLETLK
jgi:mono/diheme cytochrome c family protein